MKRMYASLALLLIAATGAFAQRHCDVSVLPLIGPADSSLYPCNATVVSGYYLVNNGPDTILSSDTLIITDPNLDNTQDQPGYISINYAYPTGTQLNGLTSDQSALAPTMDIPPGDTIIYYQWNDTITRLWTLVNADTPLVINDNGDTVFNYVLTPDDGTSIPPNGHYYWMAQFLSFTDSTQAIDTASGNNAQLNYITINCSATSINDTKYSKVSLNVYPNPTSNTINFSYTFQKATTVTTRIMDLTGRTLKTINLGKAMPGTQNYQIDVNELPAGTYLLEFATDDTKGVSKFTKD
jgi:hypothetical protein